MLLGYRENTGEIEFVFTDTSYLKKQFPNNTAKISNFWKVDNHGLKEFFVETKDFSDFYNYKKYKIINNEIISKTAEEIEELEKKNKQPLIPKVNSSTLLSPVTLKELEDRLKVIEERINKLEEE